MFYFITILYKLAYILIIKHEKNDKSEREKNVSISQHCDRQELEVAWT